MTAKLLQIEPPHLWDRKWDRSSLLRKSAASAMHASPNELHDIKAAQALLEFVQSNGRPIAICTSTSRTDENGLGDTQYFYEDTVGIFLNQGVLAIDPETFNVILVKSHEIMPAGTVYTDCVRRRQA